MIDKLRVRNFRCLRDVEVPLGPLNFLIGPNNTGKSSLLDAVQLLWDVTECNSVLDAFKRSQLGFDRVVTGGDTTRRLIFDVEASWESAEGPGWVSSYLLSLAQPGDHPEVLSDQVAVKQRDGGSPVSFRRIAGNYFEVVRPDGAREKRNLVYNQGTILRSLIEQAGNECSGLISAVRCTPKYSLDPEKMAVPCQVQPYTQLASDGSGLTSCLENLRELAPERFRELEAALKLFVDSVEAVTFPAVALGQKAVLFHEKPTGYKIPASEASDGLLLFLGYLTIAYVHGDASVMLIEEPETGVHPHRLKAIVELLRAISRGALGGRPVQVIATSHSPALLDCCGKEEIIVFQRDKQGDVHATPLAQVKDVDDLLKDFRPGELINTMGEGICESPS